MSKPPEMPKLKHLRPMSPEDPFYRRGYVVGVRVFGRNSGAPGATPECDGEAHPASGEGGLNWKGWGTLADRLGDNASLITGANLWGTSPKSPSATGESPPYGSQAALEEPSRNAEEMTGGGGERSRDGANVTSPPRRRDVGDPEVESGHSG